MPSRIAAPARPPSGPSRRHDPARDEIGQIPAYRRNRPLGGGFSLVGTRGTRRFGCRSYIAADAAAFGDHDEHNRDSAGRLAVRAARFSADWPRFALEGDADLDRIPRALVDDRHWRMRCNGDRCSTCS
jgi:hypothetical protein